MKIQYLAIIFIIIMMPLMLVLSAYMQMEIDNLTIDLEYDSKLFTATLDGLKAFELNTVNNRFSQIADSLKRDVEAGITTFITSLSNNLGYGGVTDEYLLPYIPAVVFTLYDGYYIYSPSWAEVLEETEIQDTDIDGNPITIISEKSKDPQEYDYENLLKPYIYYTVRYIDGQDTDFIVNYTLDNYMIVYGNIKPTGKDKEYVTRSGFLTAPEYISFKLDKDRLEAILACKILDYVLPPRSLEGLNQAGILELYKDNIEKVKEMNQETELSLTTDIGESLLETMKEKGSLDSMSNAEIIDALFDDTINEILAEDWDSMNSLIGKIETPNGIMDEVIDVFTEVKYKEVSIEDSDAKRYYIKSLRFSNWVNENLNYVEGRMAVDEYGTEIADMAGSTDKIFLAKVTNDPSTTNDPEELSSAFSQHRIKAIQNSIQSNLNAAIAQYNVNFFKEKTYNLYMPMLGAEEWEQVTTNISMITFLQGLELGNMAYNDYVVVTSDKNKETINIEDIYYINTDTITQGVAYYHRKDCEALTKNNTDNIVGLKNIDYDIYKVEDSDDNLIYLPSENLVGSKGIMKDLVELYGEEQAQEEYTKLRQDGKIQEVDGIIEDEYVAGEISEIYACYHCIVDRNYNSVEVSNNRLKAMYTAIAREKNNLYKVNEYYNTDIMSTYIAPPVTILGTLSEIAQVGDYVTYTANGYSNWRVLTKEVDSNIVTIISDGEVEAVMLSGSALAGARGFETFSNNVTETINAVVRKYVDGTYGVSGRSVGSNDDGSASHSTISTDIADISRMNMNVDGHKMISTDNNFSQTTGYWLLSTVNNGSSYIVMYMNSDGTKLTEEALYQTADSRSRTNQFGVRPIITLKDTAKVVGGDGSQANPWQVIYD